MAIIYESKSFIVKAAGTPHVDRDDGGHIVISPKGPVVDIQHLTPKQAIELARLSVVVGQAMTDVMNKHGVDIGRINYQDNGNWSVFSEGGPHQHLHLYGRAKSAKVQKYGQACYFPHIADTPEFYRDLKPLTDEDVSGIARATEQLLATEKFGDSEWGL